MGRRTGSLVLAVLATVALTVLAWTAPGVRAVAARAYLVLIASLAIRALVLALEREDPPVPSSNRPAEHASQDLPPRLVRIGTSLAMSGGSAREVHHRLRPILREIAADRLEIRRGIDLDAEPERAHRVLGDEAWELLRADRPKPAHAGAQGMSEDQLEAIVTSLEAI